MEWGRIHRDWLIEQFQLTSELVKLIIVDKVGCRNLNSKNVNDSKVKEAVTCRKVNSDNVKKWNINDWIVNGEWVIAEIKESYKE